MTDGWQSVTHTTRASTSCIIDLFHHHPEAALAAILSLAYPPPPASGSPTTKLVVGSARETSDGVVNIALEWEIHYGAKGNARFAGELSVQSVHDGTLLELKGAGSGGGLVGSEDSSETRPLYRVLSWLALATESIPTGGDR